MSSSRYELAFLIASHNRRERLRRCLDAIAAQTLDASSFEVIVADDGSTDETIEMVETYPASFHLRALRLKKSGKSVALNAAIHICEADVCLFVDDDVIATSNLAAEHIAAYHRDPMTLGIGPLTQPLPPNPDWFERAYAAEWNRRYEELAERRPDWHDCYGGNFSAPRKVLVAIGGFSTAIPAVEDIELGYRLCDAGCVPTYLPYAQAAHDDHKDRDRVLADIRGYGAFCAKFSQRNPNAFSKLLGWFGNSTPKDLALRRVLIALRIRPTALARIGDIIPSQRGRAVWFGFISRHSFWSGVKHALGRKYRTWVNRGVPVFMYHAFADGESGKRFVIGRRSFARQMQALAMLRYHVISLEDLVNSLCELTPLPRRAAVVTIDDGYADNLKVAAPILRRHGFTATLFLVTDRLGTENDWDSESELAGRPLLTASEVRRMQQEGFELGSHTRTHCSLPVVKEDLAEDEIDGSRADLEANFETTAVTFAYPYGAHDERVLDFVRRAGFTAACTAVPNRVHLGTDPLRIPRLEVLASDSITRFLRKLWLGGP